MTKTDESPAPKVRVAILGGGPAGLAAAHGLSSTPEQRERYEVTVYQAGWRVGGKCGSGRRGPENRIAQNGTHYLFGAYDNCFSLVRQAYDVLEDHQDVNFGTYDAQFIPRSLVVAEEFFRGDWHPWPVCLPTNDARPGGGGDMPTLASTLDAGLQVLVELVAGSRILRDLQRGGVFPSGGDTGPGARLGRATRRAGFAAIEKIGSRLVHLAKRLTDELIDDAVRTRLVNALVTVLRHFRSVLWSLLSGFIDVSLNIRRLWIAADLAIAVLIGAIEDDIFTKEGLEAIDEYDLREWLEHHGANAVTVYSAPLTSWYNAIAAYADGDTDRPNMSAGVGLHALFRLGLTYKGSFTYQMAAEVGDSVVAPLFQSLR